jgi:phosphatidylinositol alpha-1,6-mannosyltransferase
MNKHNEHSINHILLITWNFPPKKGGMENLNWNIYQQLSCHAKVSVIAPYSDEIESDPSIHRAPVKGFVFFLIYAFARGLYAASTQKPQIVFGGSLVVAPLLVFFKLFCPVAAYAHGLDVIYDNGMYQALLRFSLRFLDGIVCNSSNTGSLIREKNDQVKNIIIIAPCIEFAQYQTKPPCKPAFVKNRYILSLGRLTERKGLIEFIENCYIFLLFQYPDIELVIAGGEPSEAVYHKTGYKKKIEECIKLHNLQSSVHLVGWIDDDIKKQLLAHCECMVFPVIPREHDVEGFGIVTIEAAAYGKPTVAFNVDGVGDAIIEGVTGKLIPLHHYLKMRESIQLILQGTTEFKLNMTAVKKKYDCSHVIYKYLDFFQKVLSHNKRKPEDSNHIERTA